jgi:hypothetical protein
MRYTCPRCQLFSTRSGQVGQTATELRGITAAAQRHLSADLEQTGIVDDWWRKRLCVMGRFCTVGRAVSGYQP